MEVTPDNDLLQRLGTFVAKISSKVQRPGKMLPDEGEEGSAYIIAPRYIATAAHVIARDAVRLSIRHGTAEIPLRAATVAFIDNDLDIAVIRVPDEWWQGIESQIRERHGNNAWFEHWHGKLSTLGQAQIRIVHYPGGSQTPQVTPSLAFYDIENDDTIASEGPAKFWYSAHGGTVGGSSGAPIFDYSTQVPVFVGLHQGSVRTKDGSERGFGAPVAAIEAALARARAQEMYQEGLAEQLVRQLAEVWIASVGEWFRIASDALAEVAGGSEDEPRARGEGERWPERVVLSHLAGTHRRRFYVAFDRLVARIMPNQSIRPEVFFDLLDWRHRLSRELASFDWESLERFEARVLLVRLWARWIEDVTARDISAARVYRKIAGAIAERAVEANRREWQALKTGAPDSALAEEILSYRSWEPFAEDLLEAVTELMVDEGRFGATTEDPQTLAARFTAAFKRRVG